MPELRLMTFTDTRRIHTPKRTRQPKPRYYLGILKGTTTRELCISLTRPTAETHPQYDAAIGPFQTVAGARFMRDTTVQTVAEAERLAARPSFRHTLPR